MTVIQGIDVSKHQETVDWEAVSKDDGNFRFGIAKASEGADYVDPSFSENMRSILELNQDAGKVVFYPGAYHFARPDNRTGRSGGEKEGRHFVDVLQHAVSDGAIESLEHGFLEPWLDFEKYSDSDDKDNIPWVEGFLYVLHDTIGRKGGIYTGPNIWRYEVGDTDRFVSHPLWEVKYRRSGAAPDGAPTRMPNNMSKEEWVWSIWQWSGGGDYAYYGEVDGVRGDCDVNRFNGTEDDLAKLAGGQPCEPPTPQPSPAEGIWPRPPKQVDLGLLHAGITSDYVARVQGLLLAHGYGPDGLVSSKGRPDGRMGDRTATCLKNFKAAHGLPADTVVDWDTWWVLAYARLSG